MNRPRRIAFRLCMVLVMPSARAQAHLAGLFRRQVRATGPALVTMPLVVMPILLCWVPARLVTVVGLRIAVSIAAPELAA
jgi:hypothetical protein